MKEIRKNDMDEEYSGILTTDRKYTISIEEAARYYGIGEKKIRQIIDENPAEIFYLEIGRKILLKRKQFEQWLDGASSL